MGSKWIKYLTVTALVVVMIHTVVGVLNYLVDPLWFFGGNKLHPRNFPFDERTARAAHYVTSDRDFDCYILGASRVAMMNEHKFSGRKCFMVSFANGTPRELLAYASYMKARAKREPELVIVGVDDFVFLAPWDIYDLPPPVSEDRSPYFWQYYFSGDVARWSIQTILDAAPRPRYYGGDLTGQIRTDAGSLGILEAEANPNRTVNWEVISRYSEFRELFPEARLVSYATPVSAQRIVEYHESGVLDVYLTSLHATAAHFDEMYDFSIPSEYTTDPTLTYDGSHYQPWVNDLIVTAIENREPGFGIIVKDRSVHEIRALYAERLAALALKH